MGDVLSPEAFSGVLAMVAGHPAGTDQCDPAVDRLHEHDDALRADHLRLCNENAALRAERDEARRERTEFEVERDRYKGLVHRKNRQGSRFYRRMFANAEERDRLREEADRTWKALVGLWAYFFMDPARTETTAAREIVGEDYARVLSGIRPEDAQGGGDD